MIGTNLFTGIKCMLECLYWYKKDTNKIWDFDIPGGWHDADNYVISKNWYTIVKQLQLYPIVMFVKSNQFYRHTSDNPPVGNSDLFSRHNGIITRKYEYGSEFIYMASPQDVNGANIFAAVIDDAQRSTIFQNKDINVFRAGFEKANIIMFSREERPGDFNIVSTLDSAGVRDFLSRAYVAGPDQKYVSNLKDATMPVVTSDKSGCKYENIKALFEVDRGYEKLINTLDSINPEIASKLDLKLGMDGSASFLNAISKMSGN